MKTEQITQGQIIVLFINFFYSTLIGFAAGQLIAISQYDSLIAIGIGGLGGCVYTFFLLKLAKRRPNQFIVHYGKEIFPYWLHLIFMGLFCFSFLHICAFILREYEDFIVQTYLPQTPNWAVGILFGLVIGVTARSGITTLFRAAQGLFFLLILSDIVITLSIAKEIKWERAMAFITSHSWQNIKLGSYFTHFFFGEVVLMLFIFPYLTRKNKTFKSMVLATSLSLILILINMSFLILLFGPNLASHLTYPMLEMVRFIHFGDFIENLDPLLISIWSMTVFCKISLLFYVAVQILAQLFGLKDHRPLVLSLVAIVVTLSIQMSRGSVSQSNFLTDTFPTYIYVLETIPILYLLMDTLKRFIKKKSTQKAEAN